MKKPLMRSLTRCCAPKPSERLASVATAAMGVIAKPSSLQYFEEGKGYDESDADAVDQTGERARLRFSHLRRARLRFGQFHQPRGQRSQHACGDDRQDERDADSRAARAHNLHPMIEGLGHGIMGWEL